MTRIFAVFVGAVLVAMLHPASATGHIDITNYADLGAEVDRTGHADASKALSRAVAAANIFTARGEPACVYVPSGRYRIVSPPPPFIRAGCVIGDGPTQSELDLDPNFEGDLFAWSEAWSNTTPGPRVTGIGIRGHRNATALQNALVFYDRNDNVFIDDVDITDLHGRALFSGATKDTSQAYMRESHISSIRLFRDGAENFPVAEFSSKGAGDTDATNELHMSQIDIYAPAGPGLVIRNGGSGVVRNITVEGLRIEGAERDGPKGNLLTVGDAILRGNVNNIRFTDLELISPYRGYAALVLTAPHGVAAPYEITVTGFIGGGRSRGQGLRIDAGRNSMFRFSGMNSESTNVVIGAGVSGIVLDGGGQEADWSYQIDPTSANGVSVPSLLIGDPSKKRPQSLDMTSKSFRQN